MSLEPPVRRRLSGRVRPAGHDVGCVPGDIGDQRRGGPAGQMAWRGSRRPADSRPDVDTRGAPDSSDVITSLVLLTFPLALLLGLLRSRLARAAASDLLVELDRDADLQKPA